MTIFRITLLFILSLSWPSVAGAGFKEQRLGLIPPGYQLDPLNIVFAPDGSKAAFAVRLESVSLVVFGDTIGKPYNHVRHIAISPDGRSVAHNGTVVTPGGDLEYRIVNAIETGPFQQVCNPIFSPDSRSVVFEAKYGDAWSHAVSPAGSNQITAETGKADLHWMEPVFSSDGRLIVSIQQHQKINKNVRLVSTAAELREVYRKEYDSITGVVYNANRDHTAYIAIAKNKQFVVTSSFAGGDEQEGKVYDAISQLVLSGDGRHIAYFAQSGRNRFVVVDGREIPAPFLNELFAPALSRDGSIVAYAALKERRQSVVLAGTEGPFYDALSGFTLSPDGRITAYGGLVKGKWRLIVNGNEGPAYDYVDAVQFMPGAQQVVFRAARGSKRTMVIADLKARVIREGPMVDQIWVPSFDEEGRLGYGALSGREIWWYVLK